MWRRLILIKPNNEGDPLAEIDRVLEAFPELVGKVKGLERVSVRNSCGLRTQGFYRVLELYFIDANCLQLWGDDPLHVPIRETLTANAEMIVLDLDEGERFEYVR